MIKQVSLGCLLLSLLASCTSVQPQADGTVIVPRFAEVRSPFGTNAGYVKLDRCERPPQVPGELQPWYVSPEAYVNCVEAAGWSPVYSQGQGGQIVQGALMGLGMGLMGLSMPAQSVTVNGAGVSPTAVTTNAAGGAGGAGSTVTTVINGGIHK